MRLRPRTLAPLLVLCAATLAGWCFEASGLRLNTSPSVPVGLYRIDRKASIDGDGLVAVCLSETYGSAGRRRGYLRPGSCPGGASPVVKYVGARNGDRVQVTASGIFVNGRRLQESAPSVDSRGRSLQPIADDAYELGDGELWLYSPHPSSWDSRFFGPISPSAVLGTVQPIWTRAWNVVAASPDSDQGSVR